MTGNPVSVSVLALAGFLGGVGWGTSGGAAWAQASGAVGGDLGAQRIGIGDAPPHKINSADAAQVFYFDIPAQSLDAGLSRFSMISGRSALYSSLLVARKMGRAVRGSYTPLAALQRLVEGTGLDIEEVNAGDVVALVLKPGKPSMPPDAASPLADKTRQLGYDGVVQAGITQAICANPRTALAGYRALLQFRVSPDGHVSAAELLVSTGDKIRDRMLLDALGHVQILPPPAELRQPMTMLILPGQNRRPICN